MIVLAVILFYDSGNDFKCFFRIVASLKIFPPFFKWNKKDQCFCAEDEEMSVLLYCLFFCSILHTCFFKKQSVNALLGESACASCFKVLDSYSTGWLAPVCFSYHFFPRPMGNYLSRHLICMPVFYCFCEINQCTLYTSHT